MDACRTPLAGAGSKGRHVFGCHLAVWSREQMRTKGLQGTALLVAPVTAAALIAQQVASNAVRDALFLTWFPVTSLPYAMVAAAVLAVPAAESSGRLLARFGPARVVPFVLGVSSVLFLVEWNLLGGQPRVASGLVYVHASVLGAIGISAFWSLLNERFDPHSAKALMARVAAAGAFGGLAGGVGAERVTALMSQGALFILLGLSGTVCVAGSVVHRSRHACPARTSGGTRGETERMGRDPARATSSRSRPRGRACRGACRVDGLPAQGGGRELAWKRRAAGAFLRPLLRGDVPCRVPAPGGARPRDPCPDRARRLGGQPRTAGGRGRRAWLHCPGALARHSSTRPRRDAARVDLPGRLRALLHAAGRGIQAGCQVGGGCER